MYRVIWVVAFLANREVKHHPHSSPSKHGTIIQCCFKTGQRQRRWAKIETILSKLHVFAGVLPLSIGYNRLSVGVVWGQRRRQFVGIEPAQHWTEIGWVGLHHVYRRDTRGTIHWQVSNGCWPAPVMVVEWVNVKDISFNLSPCFFP